MNWLTLIWIFNGVLIPNNTDTREHRQISIQFDNIRYSEGVLLLGFYKDNYSWEKRKPFYEIIVNKSDLKDGKLAVSLDFPEDLPGSYGIAVLDDRNANNKVDIGLLFPKEGFGFSNYYHSTFSLPKFEDFDFVFPDQTSIEVRMRYLEFLF